MLKSFKDLLTNATSYAYLNIAEVPIPSLQLLSPLPASVVIGIFLKWVEPETPPSLKKNEKYGFLVPVALYF